LKDCMKKGSCEISREGVLRVLRRIMVVFMGPYSCLFWKIYMYKAYVDGGLLFQMHLVCSW
jgi:hypothetical protein